MFSVFDYEGRVFRDTLEELYRIDPLIHTTGSGSLKDIQSDEEQLPHSNNVYAPSSSAIQSYKELLHINSKDQIHHAFEIMESDYESISDRTSAYEAVDKMKSGRFDILPVLNPERRVVGLFTYDLIFNKLADIDLGMKAMMLNPVRTFITEKVITAEPVTSIRRIAEVMYRYNLRIMPITDSRETVIGVVSYREVLNAISNDPPMSVWT